MTETQETDRATTCQEKPWLVDKRDASEGKHKPCVEQTSSCQLRDPAFPTAVACGFWAPGSPSESVELAEKRTSFRRGWLYSQTMTLL